jgi:UDP-N-acetylmuramate--alanine ligase
VPDHENNGTETMQRKLLKALDRLKPILPAPHRWLLVDIAGQRLLLVKRDRILRIYPVSSGAAGLDGRDGSGGTPPGVHTIERKIGEGQPAGAVFESREPTGKVWPAAADAGAGAAADSEADLILTRILTLQGHEDGLNRGPGCDSRERYIYLHGTNHEQDLGQPVSHGCIRLSNQDILDLFARVEEGDPVVIV